MSNPRHAFLTTEAFEAILRKCNGKAQKDARGRRFFTFWTGDGATIVYEGNRAQEPS